MPCGFSRDGAYPETMAHGILDTIGLAGTVLFAAPVALLGADFLVRGDPVQGGAFLGIAALMILVPRYVRTPGDVAGDAAGRLTEAVVESGDEED